VSLIAGNLRLQASSSTVEDTSLLCGVARSRWEDPEHPGAGVLRAKDRESWLGVDGTLYGSDPDQLRSAWDQQGPASMTRVHGEFALAHWDFRTGTLWLARDPFGTRPLFWSREGDRVAFCSELRGLLALPWVSTEPALDHLAEYLSFRYVHAPATLLRDVQAVPPGHVVRIDASGTRIQRWWDPGWSRPGTPPPDPDQAAEQVDQAMRRAVHRRLPADGPVGVLASGGLDSSAILFHARELRPDIVASTVALADDPASESPFAARAATVLGVRHEIIRIGTEELVGAVDRATLAMGQPLPSPAAVIQLLFFEHLRVHRRIVLGGDGGDEVLGGRGIEQIAQRMRRSRAVGRVPRPARGVLRALARRAGARDFAVPPDHFGADRLIGGSRVFKAHERVEVIRDIGLIRPGIRRTVLDPIYQEVDTDPLNQVLHAWQRGWLPEDSLARAERMSSRAGLEIRYPLLDRELVALCNGWPSSAKLRRIGARTATKAPLRQAMQGRLPQRLLDRPKRSLPQPLDRWLRTGGAVFLRERAERICADPAGTWNVAGVRRLVEDHLERRANHGLKLWTLILYDAWRASLSEAGADR